MSATILALGVRFPAALIAMLAAMPISVILQIALPPTVLFLGGSNVRAGDLLFRLQRASWPFRVVALLTPARLGAGRVFLKVESASHI